MTTDTGKQFRLKKPRIVQLLSIGFLLSPFFNLALALFMVDFAGWYSPKSWLALFLRLPPTEQGLHGLVMIAGILLLYQRKSSWSVAVLILAGLSIFNVISTLSQGGKFHFLNGLNLLVNAGVLVIFYFFRYPYLDQRDHIIGGIEKRYLANFQITVNQKFPGQMKNISSSGCFITLESQNISLAVGDNFEFKFEDTKTPIQVRIKYIKDGYGVHFVDVSPDARLVIQTHIELSAKIS